MSNTISSPRRRADLMDEFEITLEVFKGAGTYEFRGLTDAFSEEEISQIASNEHAGEWRWHACSYLAALDEAENTQGNN